MSVVDQYSIKSLAVQESNSFMTINPFFHAIRSFRYKPFGDLCLVHLIFHSFLSLEKISKFIHIYIKLAPRKLTALSKSLIAIKSIQGLLLDAIFENIFTNLITSNTSIDKLPLIS